MASETAGNQEKDAGALREMRPRAQSRAAARTES